MRVPAAFVFLGVASCPRITGTPDEPAIIDFVEELSWDPIPERPTCREMGQNFLAPADVVCELPLRLKTVWQSGAVTYDNISVCCLDCGEYWTVCQRSAGTTVSFSTGNSPLSPVETIPPHRPSPGLVLWRGGEVAEAVTRDRCADIQSADLEGERLAELEVFLLGLTAVYGPAAGLDPDSESPRDVCLHVSNEDPPTQNGQLVAGRISCAEGVAAQARNCRYQVVLFRRAFNDQCAAKPYNTVAHEFKHILQSIELDLPTATCDQPPNIDFYEEEAGDFGDQIVPDCDDCDG